MFYPENLINILERNEGILRAQLEGLTHKNSLLQLPFRGNCLNRVPGHIIGQTDALRQLAGKNDSVV